MAESKSGSSSNGPKKKNWQKVTKNYKARGGANRNAAAVTVTEHGLTETNVAATEIADRTAVARGIDPTKEYIVELVVDQENELIAMYGVAEGAPGRTTINRYKNGASWRISFHMGGSFAEYPSLRPGYKKVKCLVYEDVGDDGLPVMVIPIKTGKPVSTRSRGDDRPAPGSQSAAGENPKA